jgi:prophage regulatory protein
MSELTASLHAALERKNERHGVKSWPPGQTKTAIDIQRAEIFEERLLAIRDVLRRTSHSRAGLYDAMARGDFPRPVQIGPNRVAWPESVVSAWIASKMAEAA